MKKILNVNTNSTSTDIGILVARLGIAALMLTHGIKWCMIMRTSTFMTKKTANGLATCTAMEALHKRQKGIYTKGLFTCRGRNGIAGKFWTNIFRF